jgi:hypothetical protein
MAVVSFKYDLQKDAENFIRGLNSVNSNLPTKLQEEYGAIYGVDFSPDKVTSFLKERVQEKGIHFEGLLQKVNDGWSPIEHTFILRCEEMFGLKLPQDVIGYFSQNQKCTYKWRENYFFLYYEWSPFNKTIMHELLHFYTHRKYESLGIEAKKFNDIKESLTVLLNTDFADLMEGQEDKGYPRHSKMRGDIIGMRKEGKSVDEIVKLLSEQ